MTDKKLLEEADNLARRQKGELRVPTTAEQRQAANEQIRRVIAESGSDKDVLREFMYARPETLPIDIIPFAEQVDDDLARVDVRRIAGDSKANTARVGLHDPAVHETLDRIFGRKKDEMEPPSDRN